MAWGRGRAVADSALGRDGIVVQLGGKLLLAALAFLLHARVGVDGFVV